MQRHVLFAFNLPLPRLASYLPGVTAKELPVPETPDRCRSVRAPSVLRQRLVCQRLASRWRLWRTIRLRAEGHLQVLVYCIIQTIERAIGYSN
jgi:hypothetical protein